MAKLCYKKVPDLDERLATILATVENAGLSDYIGEAVSQKEHALQCACFAESLGHDEDVVIASLLHDIGHFFYNHPMPSMEGVGICDHEWLGARVALELGLSASVAELIGLHVEAKRYLCAKKKTYNDKLSDASRTTLGFQGGPMTVDEMARFERHSLFKKALQVRANDEKAKVEGFQTPPVTHFSEIIKRNLKARQQGLPMLKSKKIYFVRHAEAEGQAPEAPLTSVGEKSLDALANSLEATSPDMVISSPFTRARQTAKGIADTFGQRVYIDQRLKEQSDFLLSRDMISLIKDVIDDIQTSCLDRYVVVTHGGWLTVMISHFFPNVPFTGLPQLKRPHVVELSTGPDENRLTIWP